MTTKQQEVIHYPQLDTVLMVEKAIKEAEDYPSLRQLWLSLPKKVMYQTFKVIINYLVESHKIMICDDGKVIWVAIDNEKLRQVVDQARRVA